MFNPDTEKFSEITTEPIALDVSAGSRLGAADLVGSVAGSATSEIKSREQGIFQNITDPSELHDERVNVLALAGIAAGTWFGVACLIAGVSAHRRKSGDLVWQRRRHARRAAQRKLAEAREIARRGTIGRRPAGRSIGRDWLDRRYAQHRRRGSDGIGG